MKVRMDFVTNSSSSSFAVIHVKSDILKDFLNSHNISETFFDDLATSPFDREGFDPSEIDWDEFDPSAMTVFGDCENGSATMEISWFSKSLSETLIAILDYLEESGKDDGDSDELKSFIIENKDAIDATAEARIESGYIVTDGIGTEYALLEMKDGKGRLIRCQEDGEETVINTYGTCSERARKFFEENHIEEIRLGDYDLLPAWAKYFGTEEKITVQKKRRRKEVKAAIENNAQNSDQDANDAQMAISLEECEKRFECYEYKDAIVIEGVKKNSPVLILPGCVDGKPVIIASHSFEKKKKLEKVVFSEGVIELGSDIFNNCKALNEVVIPKTIKKVGSGMFTGTPWLANQGDWFIINGIVVKYSGSEREPVIPDNITQIGRYAFSMNNQIEKIVIPESVHSIEESAFAFCGKLKEIQLPEHDVIFSDNPFNGTPWMEGQTGWVVVNNVLLGYKYKYGGDPLKTTEEIVIPDGIETIGKLAFPEWVPDGWEHIKRIVLPEGLKVIGDMAFRMFTNLEEIVLPSTLLKIGDNVFQNNQALKRIVLPDGLQEIGSMAFASTCIEEMVIPTSIVKIGSYAFNGSSNLLIHVASGSYAEAYAKDYDLNYVADC